MSRYETYKPSGIDWIGEVPDNWKINRLKNVSEVFGRIGFRGYTVDDIVFDEDGAISLSPSNIIDQKLQLENSTYISFEKYDESPEIKIFNGDVILVKTASVGKAAIIENLTEKATINPQLVVFKKCKLNNRFLYYLVISDVIQGQISCDTAGGVVGTITQSKLLNYKCVIPKPSEQLAIANYLDDQTQKIDRLIANKKAQAEKLKELRQIEINNAVTKGLNPNAEMKDSGIEWLGKIPKHWTVKRLKNCFYIKGRIGWQELKAEEFQDTEAYCVTGTDFNNGKVEWATCYRVSYERWAIDDNITLLENDLLITKDGTIGKVAVVKNMPDKATLNSGIFLLRSLKSQISTDYFYWVLISNCLIQFNDYTKTGSTISHLYQNVFVDFKFNLPPTEEQIEIAKHLLQRTTAIDQLIKNIEAQIEKLQELRKIKIYEAVTGKIKVNAYAETTA